MSEAPPCRVLIADDDQLLLSALSQLLGLQPGFEVVGRAVDGVEAVEQIRSLRPDVALIDLDMPRLDGLGVVKSVRDVPTKLIVVTRHARPAQLHRALEAGADGFILKSTASDQLTQIVEQVRSGRRYVDPEIATLALTMRPCPLTPRQLEILAMIHEGRRTSEIAEALFLAPGTVRNYVSTAMAELGVGTGREAAALAHAEGWV